MPRVFRVIVGSFRKDMVVWGIIIYLGAGIVGAALESRIPIMTSLYDVTRWLIILLFYVFAKCLAKYDLSEISRIFCWGIILGGVVTSLVAIYEVIIQHRINFPSIEMIPMSSPMRATGLFSATAANAMAEYVAFTLPWAWWGITESRRLSGSLIMLAVFVLLVVGLLTTASRSGILVSIVGMITYYVLSKPKGKTKLKYLLIIISMICILLMFRDFIIQLGVGERVLNAPSEVDDNIILRYEANRVALVIWKEHLLFGSGFESFMPLAIRHEELGPILGNFLQTSIRGEIGVHNSYLLALMETGLIGMIGLSLALSVGLFRIYIIYAKRKFCPRVYRLVPPIFSSIIVILIASISKDSLVHRFFWFEMGLVYIALVQSRIEISNAFVKSTNRIARKNALGANGSSLRASL